MMPSACHMSSPGPSPGLTPLPPEQAIRFLETKGLKPSFAWQDMWQGEHADMFTIAKMAQVDLLADVQASLVEALRQGQSFATWKAGIQPLLEERGWWGRAVQTDPLDGQDKVVQLGSPRRLRVIYDTNIRMADAAGRWERIQERKAARPYLRYVAVLDENTREDHRRWHGIILPVDHPFWRTHYPPNGWKCRCTVQQLSARDLERRGWKVTDEAELTAKGWGQTRPWTNARTGEEIAVPVGIDPGFGYNVGMARRSADLARALVEKAGRLPAAAGARAVDMAAVAGPLADGFADWYRTAALTRPRGDIRPIGMLSPRVVARLTEILGVEPETAMIAAIDRRLGHARSPDHQGDDIAVPEEIMRRLPEVLAAPRGVLWDRAKESLIYTYDLPEVLTAGLKPGRRTAKLVILVDVKMRGRFREERVKVTANQLHTAFVVDPNAFTDTTGFILLDGER